MNNSIKIEIQTPPDSNPSKVVVNDVIVATVDSNGRVAGALSPATPAPASVAGSPGYVQAGGSEIAQSAAHRPISLNWKYASEQELAQAIVDKAFPQIVKLRTTEGTSVIHQGIPGNIADVTYVKMSDGSVVYETYLNALNDQASGTRDEPLPAYAFLGEALNDFKAIGLKQIVELNGRGGEKQKIWPEGDVAGFGPAYQYYKNGDGSISRTPQGDVITIEAFQK